MKPINLSKTGLSMSQAESISNMCNQRATTLSRALMGLNNCEKSVKADGKEFTTQTGIPVPANIVDILKQIASLSACQGFLRENIKAKSALLDGVKMKRFDIESVERPVYPEYDTAEMLANVSEDYAWNLLTKGEYAEYLEAEAYAAHVGQFIHEGKPLDKLRKQLPEQAPTEWISIKGDGTKTPVTIKLHHTSEGLLKIHEELAELHRGYEQRVNYFKAKVHNLVTLENARIARINADAQAVIEKHNNLLAAEYETKLQAYNEQIRTLKAEFEAARQAEISEVAAYKISVDPRFQPVIDLFLAKVAE